MLTETNKRKLTPKVRFALEQSENYRACENELLRGLPILGESVDYNETAHVTIVKISTPKTCFRWEIKNGYFSGEILSQMHSPANLAIA